MMRPASSVLLCAVLLCACSDPPPPPEPVVPPAPYDGPWTPLPEEGDWKDPGPFALCTHPETGRRPSCEDPVPPDPSCELGTLAALERNGAVYRAEIRLEAQIEGEWRYRPEEGGFRFGAGGSPVSVMQLPDVRAALDGRTFHVSGTLFNEFNGFSAQHSFAGCRATSPRELTGCYTYCERGALRRYGSFRAERMGWRQGESESLGGLQPVSESFVERGRPVDVYVTQGHAYVVSLEEFNRVETGGLTVLDVRDPRHPVQTVSFNLGGRAYWNGVWAKGHALYVASDNQGVLVFDISDPARPVFVRNLPASPALSVHTVFVEEDRLYAMSSSLGVTFIYDISDPLSPRHLTRAALPPPAQPPVLGNETDSAPHDAFAYQGRLYINHLAGGFAIADLGALPDLPLLGRYTYPYNFSHASAVGTFNGRTVAFEGGERLGAHLRVLDVTDPANIVKIGEHSLRGLTSIHNMVLVGTRLYVAWYHEGVRVLDVSDPSQPREVAYYNTWRDTDPGRMDRLYDGAIGIRVPGDGHVYVVDTARGLLIFDEP